MGVLQAFQHLIHKCVDVISRLSPGTVRYARQRAGKVELVHALNVKTLHAGMLPFMATRFYNCLRAFGLPRHDFFAAIVIAIV